MNLFQPHKESLETHHCTKEILKSLEFIVNSFLVVIEPYLWRESFWLTYLEEKGGTLKQ